MLRAALFDLDDTLYAQADFLRGAWEAVAARAAEWDVPPKPMLRSLGSVAAAGSDRGRIVDRALERIGRPDVPVAPLVEAFRTFVPDHLEPYPGVVLGLDALARRLPIGLVTDGWPDGQRAKIRALGLDGMFAVEVYSDVFGREHRKPDGLPFRRALGLLGIDACDAVFVGDRPDKDVDGACGVGMRAIRVRGGEHSGRPTGQPGVPEVATTADAIKIVLHATDIGATSRSRAEHGWSGTGLAKPATRASCESG